MPENKRFNYRVKNKKGIELSVNFIVMLILSLSALSLGLYFARSVFRTSNDITKTPVNKFYSQLETMSCDSTQPICIGTNRKETHVGGYVVYTLVINNQFKDKKDFNVGIKVNKGFSKDHKEITDLSNIRTLTRQFVEIDSYSHERVPVTVQPWYGTKHGVYSILVNVTYSDDNGNKKPYGVEYVYMNVNA